MSNSSTLMSKVPLTFANKITVCRIFAVPFFILAILYYSPEEEYLRFTALAIFMFAVISDLIDGYIARTRHQKTKAGAILDPLADKFLLISAFICLYEVSDKLYGIRFPVWLVVAVISRDVILLLGSMIIHLVQGELKIEPTIWGKATTFFQIVAVLGILLQIKISAYVWPVTLVLTIISGLDYVRSGIKTINSGNSKS